MLTGRNAVVTGAARGIGFASAKALAEAGATVTITDVDVPEGLSAQRKLEEAGVRVSFSKLDVSQEDDISLLMKSFNDNSAEIDILVNNAGIISKGPLEQIDLSHWQRLISINVTSVFMLTKSILPGMMKRRWGRIINIASVAGQMGGGLLGNCCYAATKGAVIAFTKGVAQEAGPAGVTCNVICPSFTETDMTASMPEKQRQTILASIPLGRSGKPEEVGAAVAFLASNEAAFITGVTFNVDGGLRRA
jgi:3-oxoacyl-[acyl-carrier protein] reductase